MYHPTAEQAEADRRAAYESGVPHGYVAPGDVYEGLPTITLTVVSELVRGLRLGLALLRQQQQKCFNTTARVRACTTEAQGPLAVQHLDAALPRPRCPHSRSTPTTSTARRWTARGGTAGARSRSRSAPRFAWRSCGA